MKEICGNCKYNKRDFSKPQNQGYAEFCCGNEESDMYGVPTSYFCNKNKLWIIIPWWPIIISIIFVFIIVGITMKYSLDKINKQNIVETIRNDNI